MVDVKRIIKRFEKTLLVVSGAAALTAILFNLSFDLLEANLYDLRMAHGGQAEADKRIVLVALDDATTKALDDFYPLSLDYHAKLLEALEPLGAKAVGYLVDLNQVNEINPELLRGEWGTRFVAAARRMENQGTVIMLGTPFDVTGEVVPPYPLSTLPHSIAVIHKDGNVFAEDKITRRALTHLDGKPVFHVDLVERLGLVRQNVKDAHPRGSFHVPEVDSRYFFFRYHDSFDGAAHASQSANLRKNSPYPMVSFAELLRGQVAADVIRGKIVLVGTLSKENSGDFAYTPYSKTPFTNPKLVVHANILDSLIHDDGIVQISSWMDWLATWAVTAAVIGWVLSSTPLYGVFATLGLALVFVLGGHIMFKSSGFWIRESQPLVGIFLSYYLVVPYRLILEYKKRWDYQRKNELLTQVEELKTNFLSLVTHDLKTPVARIQGLAEVLLKKASAYLTDRDQKTLHHIIDSTDELNRFISSILELSKVESNRLTLRFESKDLNQLIERSIEGFKAPSKVKNIEIVTNFEPLFPIQMDTSLISKVINNLIDNAIKYSPPDSEIRVETKEVADHVEISVSDQGIGMTEEERSNLFTRFFRAKNDVTTKIAGTGLGLYLTKYFIEAHRGWVDVQTEKDNGTTVRISLPISPDNRLGQLVPGLKHTFVTKELEEKETRYV